jgi:hypothetical protein
VTVDPSKPKIGIWRAIASLGNYRLVDLLREVAPAVVLGVGGSVLIVSGTDVQDRADAAGDVLAMSGALLAIVFTALAIVVAIPASRYLQLMSETPGKGFQTFLDPFLVAAGTQIALILGTLAFKVGAENVSRTVENGAFYVLGFFFAFGLFDIAALARSLVRHGVLRSMTVEDDLAAQAPHAKVTPLARERR